MCVSKSAIWIVAKVLLVLVAVGTAQAWGQQASAAVNGTVYDSTGAAMPEAMVKLENVDTSVARTTQSNKSGTYVFLNVVPGNYTVRVERTGFESVAQNAVKLDVDQTATFDFRLKVGQTQDTVTVEASAAGVESSTAELGSVIGNKEVNDLPLNGRNFTQLLTLTPGAAPVTLDQTGGGGGGFAGNALGAFSFPAVNGARVRSNIFLLDGVNNLNTFLSTYNVAPIPDAIGEFKVQTHNDDTQYGGVVGGIINVVSKSGTNVYHGSAWEYLRNQVFDANYYFNKNFADPAQVISRAPLRQNQFGAAVGGPVSIPKLYNGKDKTFFYAAYEGLRLRTSSQAGQISATPAMRMGDFSALCSGGALSFQNGICVDSSSHDSVNAGYQHQLFDTASPTRAPFLNNIIPQSRLSPVALAYQNLYPQGAPDKSNYPFYIAYPTQGVKTNQDLGEIRVDQTIGNHDQIFGHFGKYYQLIDSPQTVVQEHLAPIYGYNWTIHEAHSFGTNTVLNAYVARNYGNNEQTLNVPGGAGLLAALQTAGVSSQFLALGSLITAPAMTFPANANYESVGYQQVQATGLADVWEYGGNVTRVIGRHIINVGGSIETNGFYSPIQGSHETFAARQTGGLGALVGQGGNPYASFLLGAPDNAGNRITAESVHGGYSDNIYAHDQWKITKNLTLNFGVRYDVKLWPIYGSGTDLYTGEPNPITGQYILTALPPNCSATQGAPCIPSGIYVNNGGQPTPYSGLPPHTIVTPNSNHSIINNDYGDIAGRFGFAYRVNEKLAVRGGYGRFYDTWGAAAQDAQNFNGNWPAANLELNGLNSTTITDPITNPLHLGAGGGIIYPGVNPYNSGTWSVDPAYKTPYSDQYNFGFQQELPGNVLLDMNYVGSVSHRLDVTDVLNVASSPVPVGTGPVPTDPTPFEPFPYMENPWFQQSIGNSNFNALEISVNKRATRNLAFLVSYTWSKSIDDGCSGDIGAACSIQNVYDRRADRAVSAFDLPHVFSTSFTATSPYGKGRMLADNRLLNVVAGGWSLNGIIQLHSGTPFDVFASSSIPNICKCSNTERASVVGDPHSHGAKNINTTWFNTAAVVIPAPSTFGTLPRNDLRAQNWRNADLSLFRQFGLGLGESRNLEFRAEAFNALNDVVFGTPNTTLGATNFGHVTSQANTPRIFQFALKFLF